MSSLNHLTASGRNALSMLALPARHVQQNEESGHDQDAELVSPTTLHRFQDLPIEIRLMIFEIAVREIPAVSRNLNHMDLNPQTQRFTREPMHPLLSVCHESRLTYQKYYQRWGLFSAKSQEGGMRKIKCRSYLYVNFAKDHFRINLCRAWPHTHKKHVAMFTELYETWELGPGSGSALRHMYRPMFFISLEENGVGRIRNATVTNKWNWGRPYQEMEYRSERAVSEPEFLRTVMERMRLGDKRDGTTLDHEDEVQS